jgi:DNA gyrase/topoisomerase IV subunit B
MLFVAGYNRAIGNTELIRQLGALGVQSGGILLVHAAFSKVGPVEGGPLALIEALLAHGRKGLSIQRYKGLGEMNPEQLWETTLDPEVRTLYQVKIEHADEAGKIFETLMGDVVEPRREFIQDNALKVVNLDV